ncbi:MAG: hypothetical protein NVS9B1_12010 [Candidatus Dormibacteraceae bacterium]
MAIQTVKAGSGHGMERASGEISINLSSAVRRRYLRARVLVPLRVIDEMLEDLEQLNLVGRRRVPMTWDSRLASVHTMLPAEIHEVPDLRSNIATTRLMDRLYHLQDLLLDIKVGPIRRELAVFDRTVFGGSDDQDEGLDVA